MNTHTEFMLVDTRSFTSQKKIYKYKQLLHKEEKYNIKFQTMLTSVIAFILLGHGLFPIKNLKSRN